MESTKKGSYNPKLEKIVKENLPKQPSKPMEKRVNYMEPKYESIEDVLRKMG